MNHPISQTTLNELLIQDPAHGGGGVGGLDGNAVYNSRGYLIRLKSCFVVSQVRLQPHRDRDGTSFLEEGACGRARRPAMLGVRGVGFFFAGIFNIFL